MHREGGQVGRKAGGCPAAFQHRRKVDLAIHHSQGWVSRAPVVQRGIKRAARGVRVYAQVEIVGPGTCSVVVVIARNVVMVDAAVRYCIRAAIDASTAENENTLIVVCEHVTMHVQCVDVPQLQGLSLPPLALKHVRDFVIDHVSLDRVVDLDRRPLLTLLSVITTDVAPCVTFHVDNAGLCSGVSAQGH